MGIYTSEALTALGVTRRFLPGDLELAPKLPRAVTLGC
jgi:hypothetical protein